MTQPPVWLALSSYYLYMKLPGAFTAAAGLCRPSLPNRSWFCDLQVLNLKITEVLDTNGLDV